MPVSEFNRKDYLIILQNLFLESSSDFLIDFSIFWKFISKLVSLAF